MKSNSVSLQDVVDSMNAAAQITRAGYHLTLGELIEALRKSPHPNAEIWINCEDNESVETYPGELYSYRGYYCDLAFEPSTTPRTVAQVLAEAEAALGTTFTGYKGGDFTMGPNTPLWVSSYGTASQIAVTGIRYDGEDYELRCHIIKD